MPIEVRTEERLAEIAAATMRVARKRGADGITIRAVAAEMGGSTTLVTNYVPSRNELLSNAIQHALQRWRAELGQVLDGIAAEDELRTVALWSGTTTGDDPVVRHLLIELLARAGPNPALDALRDDGDRHHQHFRTAAIAAGLPNPDFAADVLHLVLRGFYLASVERPDAWTTARVQPIISQLVDLLPSVPAPARSRQSKRRAEQTARPPERRSGRRR